MLTAQQVGGGYSVTQESFTRAQLAQQGTYSLGQLQAWGYEGGFERIFDHDADTSQGIQIASNAGVYRTAHGAEQSLLNNESLCSQNGFSPVSNPHIGNGSVMCAKTGTEDGYSGQLYFLIWCVGRFKGSISLSGVQGKVSQSEAVSLARKQIIHM